MYWCRCLMIAEEDTQWGSITKGSNKNLIIILYVYKFYCAIVPIAQCYGPWIVYQIILRQIKTTSTNLQRVLLYIDEKSDTQYAFSKAGRYARALMRSGYLSNGLFRTTRLIKISTNKANKTMLQSNKCFSRVGLEKIW